MSAAYYNEIDPFAAAWLRELVKAGLIAPGDVDERDIRDVNPDELRGYTQCHFFAGIGVWSYALRCAGWPDERPVWTGSCPCQPFSAAGKGAGFADERHLWPAFFHLIGECRPGVVFGEQVASKDGLAWLDVVQADLEGADYAFGAFDLCAAGVGAPHIRQRLYFVAQSEHGRCQGRNPEWARPGSALPPSETRLVADSTSGRSGAGLRDCEPREQRRDESPDCRCSRVLADADDAERRADAARGDLGDRAHTGRQEGASDAEGYRCPRVLAYADGGEPGNRELQPRGEHGQQPQDRGPVRGYWADAEWIFCRDEKYRPVEPGTFPLVNGAPQRMGRLRGFGNAIVGPLAAAFIEAYREAVE